MAKDNNLQDFLTDVANAIREKKGTSELINPQDFSAEIESIQTGGLEEKAVVEVPTEVQGFSAGSNKLLYTFDLEDGTYLVSDSYSKTTWKVNTFTNEWTKLIDNGYVYSFFAKIDDKILIANKGGSSVKVYIYDILSSTIQEVIYAISGAPINTSINRVYDVGDKVLLAYTDSGRAVYVYDKATQTIILVQSTTNIVDGFKYTWNNKTLIMTRNTSGANEFLVYNNLSNTFMFISGAESLARQLYFANAKENIVTFSNSWSTLYGFYWIDLDAETFTHAENEIVDTIQINQTSILNNGVVLLGKLNTLGVYAYDTNTKTYIAENTESALGNSNMSNPENIIELQDYVLYSQSYSSGGLWQYNKANNTFMQLKTNAYAYVLIVMIMQENRALIGRKGYGFIYSFNNGVLSSNLYGTGSSYTYEIVSNTENEIIINNTNFNVQIKYNVETDTITPIGVIL